MAYKYIFKMNNKMLHTVFDSTLTGIWRDSMLCRGLLFNLALLKIIILNAFAFCYDKQPYLQAFGVRHCTVTQGPCCAITRSKNNLKCHGD